MQLRQDFLHGKRRRLAPVGVVRYGETAFKGNVLYGVNHHHLIECVVLPRKGRFLGNYGKCTMVYARWLALPICVDPSVKDVVSTAEVEFHLGGTDIHRYGTFSFKDQLVFQRPQTLPEEE